MIAWQIARHRVALSGTLVDGETGKPVAGARIAIVAMPSAFEKTLALASLRYGRRWPNLSERPDRTRTRPDGLFYFMDLPEGKYTLEASIPELSRRYAPASENVVIKANSGPIPTRVDLALRPTTVKGKVIGPVKKSGVLLAEVRIKGSGERAFSDAQGQFVLSGIEPGKRTVLVYAQGYQVASRDVTLKEPGVIETVNIPLLREAG